MAINTTKNGTHSKSRQANGIQANGRQENSIQANGRQEKDQQAIVIDRQMLQSG